VSKNAKLLIRAGFIDKLHTGVYTYLPLGLRVLKKIEDIIRREMNAIGGQELLMPSLHPKENWEKTGRWSTMDDLYKVKDASGREMALAGTHEEVIVPLVKQFISSYKDLPFSPYQFQNKFRMELRAKSGLLRGREFIMKDMYSFHTDEKDLKQYYGSAIKAYADIFNAVGIGEKTYLTFASGGTFSKYSHEFQTVTDAGEDTVFICSPCSIAVNKEIIDDQKKCPECSNAELKEERAIEVGNIFELKTKFSDAFNLKYKDKQGIEHSVVMGCYGIGLGRLMGVVAEVYSDEKGLIWPQAIAPFNVHLIALENETKEVSSRASQLNEEMQGRGISVLYDDRTISAGVKFADADLIGIPTRVVVSKALLKKDDIVEIKDRKSGAVEEVKISSLLRRISPQ